MLVSCQAYKSVSSKYNILYNGELFLDEGISQLKESYNENFWEIIPVLTENNITNTLPDYPSKNFLKSEEKAIKVIQKMGDDNNIDSEYINQAYLLLGKSRFYDKRYLSSIQALNYILKQNKKSKFCDFILDSISFKYFGSIEPSAFMIQKNSVRVFFIPSIKADP